MTIKKSDVVDVEQNMKRLLNSPSYRLAMEDPDFIEGNDGRETRVLAEALKVERTLRRANVASTIIVFGSARIKSPEVAQARLRDAQLQLRAAPENAALQQEVARANNVVKWSKYYQLAREFGEVVARKNDPFNEEHDQRGGVRVSKKREFVICTGGGPGIMEAANRGAFDAGEATVGLNIKLPFEQQPNPFVSENLCFNFRYFSIRKFHFLLRAKALVAFPGGFGTFDELFEALTLRQTGKMQDLPIVLYGKEFWTKVVNFDYLVETGVISASDLRLFNFAETAEEGWQIIKDYYDAKRELGTEA